MKTLYRHKRTGDLFAIETDERGNVISTSGPLLTKDLNLLCSLGSGITAIYLDPGVFQQILGTTGLIGTGSGISSIKKIGNIPRCIIQGLRQTAEYDTEELKRLLKNKLDMLQ